MSLFSITSLMIFFASLGFASFLYLSDRESKVNKAWLHTSTAIAIWGLSLYGVTTSNNSQYALFWQYLLDVAAVFIPVLYYIFISTFLELENRHDRILAIFLGSFLALFSFTPLFKTGVVEIERFGFYWIEPGELYFIFPVFFAFYLTLSIYELYKKYLTSHEPMRRAQILSVLLVGLIGLTAGSTNFFPQFSDIYPFGNYFLLLYIFFMGYGVLRYKLISAKVIGAQLFSGALILILLFSFLNSNTAEDRSLNLFVLVAVSIFSLFLIRSVYREVESREESEKLAEDLQDANAKLHKVNMLKSEFVSVATHQLRSPLTAIKGYTSMILEGGYGDVPQPIKDPLERISRSTETLTQVVQDFLDVSRIEQGRMRYDMAAFSFKDLVREVVGEQQLNIDKSGLEFSVDIEDENNPNAYIVRGDRVKLKQVVGNLVDNAIKYTQEGFVRVKLKHGSAIRFEVEDSGMGIDKKTLGTLFKKFNRADTADEVNVSGTGLGLYIAREIMAAHEGKIWAESDGTGKGATFIAELSTKVGN